MEQNKCSWGRYSGICFFHVPACQNLLFLSTEAKKLLNILWSGVLIYFWCLFSVLNKNIPHFFVVRLRIILTGSYLIILNLLKCAGTSSFYCLLFPSSRMTSLFQDWLPYMFLVLTRFTLVIMVDLKPFL